MTRDEFDVLIQKLEKVSKRHPRLYLARVAGLVALAYGYLALILAGSLAFFLLMIGMIFVQPITFKLALIGMIASGGVFSAAVRGFWVKLPAPVGQTVSRREAPRLFDFLDELRAALDCRPFHQVLIVGDMNAAVVQTPRLGILGWHKNYLLLGLPLMQSLSPEEFKAVLAHEFAHSSRGHGRFGNWLYRVRRSWAQVMERLAKQPTRWGAVVFKFIQWFWPLFNGHVFVLARANEYEADACSVRLAGADAAAAALIRVRLAAALTTEKFWPEVLSRASREEMPPTNIMLAQDQTLRRGPAPDDAARWMSQAFLLETNNADTHPSLKDRLRAIGRLPVEIEQGAFPVTAPPSPTQNAAECFLGDFARVAAGEISDKWRAAISKQWSARYEHAQKLAGELAEMERLSNAPLTAAQLWERARRLVDLGGDASALSALEQVVALESSHPGANFILGRHHLHKDDPRGVQFIETAMTSDPTLTQNGCNLLYSYYNRTGQRDKLRPLANRVDEHQKLNAAAQQERARISVADTFIAPDLTAEQVALLKKIFDSEPDLFRMAVVRKQVKLLPASPCYVVALEIKPVWWKPRKKTANAQLVHRVLNQAQLPGYRLVFACERNRKKLGAIIFSTAGAFLFTKQPGGR